MALTPTTWDPATKGFFASLSGDDLVYSTSNYYDNTVKTVFGTTAGAWYWEILLDVFPVGSSAWIGADASGVGGLGIWRESDFGGLWQGDVLGFALDADAGSIEFFRNGVSLGVVDGMVVESGGAWRPQVQLTTIDSTTLSAIANFGGDTFYYDAPAGYAPGFGEPPLIPQISGIEAAGAGAPSCPPNFVIQGIESAGIGGSPALTARPLVPGIEASGAGMPYAAIDRTVRVYGIGAAGAGYPSSIRPAPPPPVRHRVAAIVAEGAGHPTSFSDVVVGVPGLESAGAGSAAATLGCAVQGIEIAGLGPVGVTAKYRVAAIPGSMEFGTLTSTVTVFAPGVEAPGPGRPGFFGQSSHFVWGVGAAGVGTPSSDLSYLVAPMPLPPGLGVPTVRPLPC